MTCVCICEESDVMLCAQVIRDGTNAIHYPTFVSRSRAEASASAVCDVDVDLLYPLSNSIAKLAVVAHLFHRCISKNAGAFVCRSRHERSKQHV